MRQCGVHFWSFTVDTNCSRYIFIKFFIGLCTNENQPSKIFPTWLQLLLGVVETLASCYKSKDTNTSWPQGGSWWTKALLAVHLEAYAQYPWVRNTCKAYSYWRSILKSKIWNYYCELNYLGKQISQKPVSRQAGQGIRHQWLMPVTSLATDGQLKKGKG